MNPYKTCKAHTDTLNISSTSNSCIIHGESFVYHIFIFLHYIACLLIEADELFCLFRKADFPLHTNVPVVRQHLNATFMPLQFVSISVSHSEVTVLILQSRNTLLQVQSTCFSSTKVLATTNNKKRTKTEK